MRTVSASRRRGLGGLLCALLLSGVVGVGMPARAEGGLIPSKCEPKHGGIDVEKCVDRLVEQVDGSVPRQNAYPDLQPNVTEAFILRPPVFDPDTRTFSEGPPQIWFDSLAMNVGDVPFDLLADDPADTAGTTVSQCVSWTTDLLCRERRQVGGFSWHQEHGHFHFNDFAAYAFRRLLADGTVDYSAAGLVAVSDKVSFCLMDSTTTRDDASPVSRYPTCNSVRQGISPGWADVYTADLEGQQMEIAGVTDGRYALVIDLDTVDHVYETDNANNRVEVIVEVSKNVRWAEIVDRRWP